VTGEVKAAVEVEVKAVEIEVEVEVEVEAPSIDHSYTDLLAFIFVVFCCSLREKNVADPSSCGINAADNQ
jgi:hypothetical protein